MPAGIPVVIEGVKYNSRMKACEAYSHAPAKIDHRMRSGMTFEEAILSKDRYTGRKKHPLYTHWNGMRSRCYSKSACSKRYKGRISVCKRWMDDFYSFVEDMQEGFEYGLSVDRIDNDGDYTPENCRWATRHQQQRNKSTNVYIECFGERMILQDWAIRLGVCPDTISHRIKIGWTLEKALTEPSRKGRKN